MGIMLESTRARQSIVLGMLVLCLVGCGGAKRVKRTITGSRDLTGPMAVNAVTANGRIEFTATTGEKLMVRAVILAETQERADACSILIDDTAENGSIGVSIAWPGDERRPAEGAHLVIKAPTGADVTLSTSNGAVTAIGVEGRLRVSTDNRKVEIANCEGDVLVEHANGNVVCSEIQGALSIENANGHVRAVGVRDGVTIKNSNGRVELVMYPTAAEPIDIENSNGRVEVVLGRAQEGIFDLETSNAKLDLELGSRGKLIERTSRSRARVSVGERKTPSSIRTTNQRIRLEAP